MNHKPYVDARMTNLREHEDDAGQIRVDRLRFRHELIAAFQAGELVGWQRARRETAHALPTAHYSLPTDN